MIPLLMFWRAIVRLYNTQTSRPLLPYLGHREIHHFNLPEYFIINLSTTPVSSLYDSYRGLQYDPTIVSTYLSV